MHEAIRSGLLPLINLVLRGWHYRITRGRLWVSPPATWAGVCLAPILIS